MATIYKRLRERQARLYEQEELTPRARRRVQRELDEVEHLFALMVHALLDIIDMRAGHGIQEHSPFAAR